MFYSESMTARNSLLVGITLIIYAISNFSCIGYARFSIFIKIFFNFINNVVFNILLTEVNKSFKMDVVGIQNNVTQDFS